MELLIGAAKIDACQSTVSLYCLFRFRLHATTGKNYSEFRNGGRRTNFNSVFETSLLELERLGMSRV